MKKDIKRSAGGRRAMKASALLALLFAGNVAKGLAEEITGTILWEPISSSFRWGFGTKCELDTRGKFVTDMNMFVPCGDTYDDLEVYGTLVRYLKQDSQVIFENQGLTSKEFNSDRLIAVIDNKGRRIEIEDMFSRDIIKQYFPYLDKKLKAQGQGR
jgi:hypothetical protein